MSTEGTFDFSENDAPSPAGTSRRRLSVTSAGVLRLTDASGVTTDVAGTGGWQPWVHNAPVLSGASPYTPVIQETVKVQPDTQIVTVALPTAVGIAGFQIKVVSLSDVPFPANAVTVAAFGGEFINGVASKTLTTARERITVESDGTGWLVVD